MQFSHVFELYYNRIYLFAHNLIKIEAEAKDIATETFIKLWRLHENFESLENIKAFLFVTTRNACIDYFRSLQRQRTAKKEISYLLDPIQNIENEMIKAEVFDQLSLQIEGLPQQCRKIFKLIYYQNCDTFEVAKKLNITPRNVLNQKARAIQFLRSMLIKNSFLETSLPVLLILLSPYLRIF